MGCEARLSTIKRLPTVKKPRAVFTVACNRCSVKDRVNTSQAQISDQIEQVLDTEVSKMMQLCNKWSRDLTSTIPPSYFESMRKDIRQKLAEYIFMPLQRAKR